MNPKAICALTLFSSALLLILLSPAPTRADPYPPTISAPNDGQGHIYLTFQPCKLEIVLKAQTYTSENEPLYYAYSTVLEGTAGEIKSHACWFVPKVNTQEMLKEYGNGFPVVNIIAESGLIFPHPIGEFTPGEPAQLERADYF